MADFTIKANDTSPNIQATLKDATGAAVDITGAAVKFQMRAKTGTTFKVDATATIINAVGGIVRYTFLAADTNTPGPYYAQWQVTFAGGTIETYPNSEYIELDVFSDLP